MTKWIKWIKWILIEVVLFALVLTGVMAVATLYVRPYLRANTALPKDSILTLKQQESGDIQISWPKANRADYYLFEVYQLPNGGNFTYQNCAGELVYSSEITGLTSVTFPADAYSGNMLFRITSAVRYMFNGEQKVRFCADPLEAVVDFDLPLMQALTCTTDQQNQRASIRMETEKGTHYVIYYKDANGKYQELKTITEPAISLNFSEEGDLALPTYGKSVDLKVAVYRKGDGFVYYSNSYAEISIPRDTLVPADFALAAQKEETGYRLAWEEKECDYYDIQVLNAQSQKWESICRVEGNEEPTCLLTVDSVANTCVFRVVAAYQKEEKNGNGEVALVEKYRAISNEIRLPAPEIPVIPIL